MPSGLVLCAEGVAHAPRVAAPTPAATPCLMKSRRLTDALSRDFRSSCLMSRFLAISPPCLANELLDEALAEADCRVVRARLVEAREDVVVADRGALRIDVHQA